MDSGVIPEHPHPDYLNAASELLDGPVTRGWGERVAFRSPSESVTYGELLQRANRIAHVLVDDCGLVPGNRVLLRGANSPTMVALWFAVLKAGGVVVCTMPLLRAREMTFTADKARIGLAITDARIAEEGEQATRSHANGAIRDGARVLRYGGPGSAAQPSLEELMAGKPATFFENVRTAADDVGNECASI